MTGFALSRFHDPLRPPEAPGIGRGFAFALVAHALLFVALSLSVAWHTSTPPAFEAELWSAVPQAAAPKEVLPPPEPEPEVKPEVKPQPPQPSAEELQAQRDAEIAVEKAKKEKERKAQEERDKALEKKRADEKKAADEKQKKLDQDKKDKQEKLDKLKADKAAKELDAKREALRQQNIERMMGMAGASGGPTSRGSALKSSGPSSSYSGRIVARVKPNIIYSGAPVGKISAEVEVRAAPDGTIIGRKLLKPSGDPDYDRAVLRAIDKTEILPRDVDGSVPSLLQLVFSYPD